MTIAYLLLLLTPPALTAWVLLRQGVNSPRTRESCECCQDQHAEIERPLV